MPLLFSSVALAEEPEEEKKDEEQEENFRPDDCTEDDVRPRCQFEFDEDGRIRTKSGDAERTFAFPPLKTGFILDIGVPDFLPYVALEIFNVGILGETFAMDVGGSSGRIFLSLDYELLPIMKLGPMLWFGYNVPEETYSYGLGFTILKF